MDKIIIIKRLKEPIDSTIGAFIYAYSINYNGDYAYTLRTTEESMMYLIIALRKGSEVQYIGETNIKQ